jgi:hypothetical protein
MNRWVIAGFMVCGCGAVCPDDADVQRSVTAGTYVPAPAQNDCTGTPIAPSDSSGDYQLTVSDDRATVTVVYARQGKSYRVVYDVTASKTLP